MKKIIGLLLSLLLVCGITTTKVSANYDNPRGVKGPVLEGASTFSEGVTRQNVFALVVLDEDYDYYNITNSANVELKWTYEIPQGKEDVLALSTTKFSMSRTNFGKRSTSSNVSLSATDKSAWPENLRDRLEYSISDDKATFTYTLSPDEIDWMINNKEECPLIIAAYNSFKKLPTNTEVGYASLHYSAYVYVNGQKVDNNHYANEKDKNFYSDKKTVEIKEEVAPVASDGTVGTYNSDPSKTTNLYDNKEAIVKLTLTRPVGVANSGDNEVNIKVPDGMEYVPGSMTATSSNGLTVNLTDSATAPKFDFTGLPVGENVVVTYKLKVANDTVNVDFKTNNTLTNGYQKGLSANINNDYVNGNVYSEDEYNTTTSLPMYCKLGGANDPLSKHNVTVNYVYADGSEAAPQYVKEYTENDSYSISSPTIAGYKADKTVVSGTMAKSDVTVTVTYAKDETEIIESGSDDDGTTNIEPTKNGTSTNSASAVKTGDDIDVINYMVVASLSFILISLIALKKKFVKE